jgi:hypothetical protein
MPRILLNVFTLSILLAMEIHLAALRPNAQLRFETIACACTALERLLRYCAAHPLPWIGYANREAINASIGERMNRRIRLAAG